jgi:hypothetical protein
MSPIIIDDRSENPQEQKVAEQMGNIVFTIRTDGQFRHHNFTLNNVHKKGQQCEIDF